MSAVALASRADFLLQGRISHLLVGNVTKRPDWRPTRLKSERHDSFLLSLLDNLNLRGEGHQGNLFESVELLFLYSKGALPLRGTVHRS